MWRIICPPNNYTVPIPVEAKPLELKEVANRLDLKYTEDQESKKIYVGNNPVPTDKALGARLALAYPGPMLSESTQNLKASAAVHFPIIISEARRVGLIRSQLAYVLATATHESGAGQWMEEWADGSDYEGRADLGNTQPGDGVKFKGRGYVQLTGRANYASWSRQLNMELVKNPGAVKATSIAAKILVQGMARGTFTGVRLSDFISLSKLDFVNARKIINGLDRAKDIAAIAHAFDAELQKI